MEQNKNDHIIDVLTKVNDMVATAEKEKKTDALCSALSPKEALPLATTLKMETNMKNSADHMHGSV